MRQTFQPAFARMLLAIALTCALLVTQFALTRHVVEHAAAIANTVATVSASDDLSNLPDGSNNSASCLTCLEHQAHGAGLISTPVILIAQPTKTFELQALAPNTPYLAPERASQRAPPVLS